VNDSPEPVDLSPSRDELIARVRARGRQIRARRRLGIASITAVVVIGIAAPAIAFGMHSSEPHRVPPATVSTTRPPSTVAQQPDLVVSIELPSNTVVAGSQLHGTLVIDNTTGHAVPLDTPGECAGKWAVELTSPTASQHTAWTLECARGKTVPLAPGASRFPFTITTTFSSCTNSTGPGSLDIVHCLSGPAGGIPPLPPGDFEAALVTSRPGYLPLAPRVPVRIVAAAAPSTTDLGQLRLESGARTTKLLVPAGWTLAIEDGGGSGSASTWANPADPKEQIYGSTGGELGSWWEIDGVKGSITPQLAAPGAQVQRVNYTTFLFHSDPPNGYPIDGVWIALVTKDGPNAFVSASVQLPSALHSTATTIIDRFISDTNAMVPPFAGPTNH
jgi:hypothetical protein